MKEAFEIVVLGCTGGPWENNLSSYLLSPLQDPAWIALDAGSLLGGIDLAIQKNSFPSISFSNPSLSPAGEVLNDIVQAYLISHAHLDHIVGLVLNSQVDCHKYILGIDSTIDNLRDHIFNGRIWPNFGSEGVEPMLHQYEYVRLPLHQRRPIPDTPMSVEAFLLSHPRGYPSTAFLIEHKDHYLIYFGDTSSDFYEIEKHLSRIWHRIAPLHKEKKLHAIMLECSYSQNESDQAFFGHLDTKLMMKEFHQLAKIVEVSLEGLPVIVTHRKETLKSGPDMKALIEEELKAINDLGLHFIFPSQGDRFIL